MTADTRRPGRGWRVSLAVTALVACVAWPAWMQERWGRGATVVHGVPALFFGGLLWVVGVALAGFVAGGRRDGWRSWLRRGGPRWLGAMLVLGVSIVGLFYAVEAWRGRRAWARVAALAKGGAENLDARTLEPAAVPAGEDFGQVGVFAPLWRVKPPGDSLADASSDLGALSPLLAWAGRGWRLAGSSVPGWMTGDSEPPGQTPAQRRRPNLSMRREADGTPRLKLTATNASPGGAAPDPIAGAEARREQAVAFLRSVEAFVPLLEQGREAVTRPHCRLPFDVELALAMDATGERVLCALERLAFQRAGALMAAGRGEEALADLHMGFELARHARNLPGVFFGRRAIVLAEDGMQALWEGLARGEWSMEQVGALQRQLTAEIRDPVLEVRQRLRWVALCSAGFVESVIPTAPAAGPGLERTGMTDSERGVLGWVRRLYPSGWSLQDQASVLDTWLRFGLTWSPGEPGGFASEIAGALRTTSDPFYPVFVLPKVRQLWEDAVRFSQLESACWQLAAAACGVERQRLRSGSLPDTLGPDTRAAGSPTSLHYLRVDEQTYRIYHEGLNGRDDGGMGPPDQASADAMLHAPDWGWTGRVAPMEARR